VKRGRKEMSPIFLNVSIEGIHQMPQVGINPELKVKHWKSKGFTLTFLKSVIRKFFGIPDNCDFALALYFCNSDGWKNKEVLPPSTSHSRLKGKAAQYVTKSNEMNEMSILSVHIYPTTYIAVRLAFSMNPGFPKIGLVDFEKTNLMQQNPIAFIAQNWEKEELTAEMEKLIYHYMLRVAEMEDLTLSKCNLNIFSEDGNEHLSAETINQGDRVILQVIDESGVIDSAVHALNWTDYPLMPSVSINNILAKKSAKKRKRIKEIEVHDKLETRIENKRAKVSKKVEHMVELNSDDDDESSYHFTSAYYPEHASTLNETLEAASVQHTAVKYCSICLIKHPMDEMYPINCCSHHSFCVESLLQCVKTAITGSADSAPHIPACPLANLKEKGCKYMLQQNECEQIIGLSLSNSVITWAESEKFLKTTEKLYLVSIFFSRIDFILIFHKYL
jgi:hypothetical protein